MKEHIDTQRGLSISFLINGGFIPRLSAIPKNGMLSLTSDEV